MRKHLCWLLGHSYICLYRRHRGGKSSEVTGWMCQHCGKQRHHQWDN